MTKDQTSAFVVHSRNYDGAFVCVNFAELVQSLAMIFPQGKPLSEAEDEVTITIDSFDQEYINSLAEYTEDSPAEN